MEKFKGHGLGVDAELVAVRDDSAIHAEATRKAAVEVELVAATAEFGDGEHPAHFAEKPCP